MNWLERYLWLAVVAELGFVRQAHAEDTAELPARTVASALTVRYEGDCVQASEVAARVQRWLRTDSVDRRLSIVVEGGESPKGRMLSFVVFSDGEMVAVRRFGSLTANCESVLDVLSFSIAVSIDASVSERAVAGDAPSDGSSKPTAQGPSKPTASVPPNPGRAGRVGAPLQPSANAPKDAGPSARRAERKGSLTAAVFSTHNLLPGAALGAEITARVRLERGLSPGLGFVATAPNRFAVGKAAASGAVFAGRADLEKSWDLGPLGAGAATGFLFGSAQVAGLGLVRAKSVTFFWSVFQARLLLEMPVGSYLALHADGGGSVALTRPVLEVASADGSLGASQMFPAFGVSASLGVTAILR
ncbi:MAG: hypothetical protein SFV15_12230 [Polyangiaceae bacterium]|nr:hypothetical protein [Polyangiaceae bacterium]